MSGTSNQPLLSSSSCHFLRELTSKMFKSLLSCGSMEEILERASAIQHDIDEICVKALPVSNHIDDEDNHNNNDEKPTKSAKISVSMAHQLEAGGEYREKFELLTKLREMNEKITHEKILLLSIGEYVKKDFFPPCIADLIAMTERLARNSKEGIICDYNVPFILEEREKLLKFFFQQAYEKFTSERERKIFFTLTILRMLKNLGDSIFTFTHPRNRLSELRLSFFLPSLFFAIPYYKFIFDWFNFDNDSIAMQLLFVKFLEIKIATASWTKFMRPMTFENAVVLFGSKNPFQKRALAAPITKCTVNMTATREMIEAILEFMRTSNFEWEKVAKKFAINFQLSCRNRVENCRSSFFMNINYEESKEGYLQSRDELQ